MFWKTLKIEPTSDRKEIQRAYRELLSDANPEVDPEAFKQLREAYEQAMAYADEHGEKTQSPLENWKVQLEQLYDDFQQRITVAGWQKLLNQDICLAIGSRKDCESALLEFLQEKYLLPHEVWLYLDEQFSWMDHLDELYESCPPDFVDYVIVRGIRHDDLLPLDMFVPGEDGEEINRYLRLYNQAGDSQDKEESHKAMEEMLALKEKHLYGEARALSMQIEEGDKTSLEKLVQMQKEHPQDLRIGVITVRYYYYTGNYDACWDLIEQLQKIDEEMISLRWYKVLVMAETNRHQEAVQEINSMMRDTVGDTDTQYQLNQKRMELNETVMIQLQQKLQDDPTDYESLLDLCWTYLENNKNDEAIKLAQQLPEQWEDNYNLYNLKASLAITAEKYDEAAAMYQKVLEETDRLPEDTKKNIQRKKRKGEMLSRIGYCYYCMEDREKAARYYDMALQCDGNKSESLSFLIQAALSDHEFEKAVEYAKQLINENPDDYHGYLLLAYSYYFDGEDREAFNAVNKALDLYGADVSVYVLKALILLRNNGTDGAKEIIDFLLRNGLENDPMVLYAQGVLKEDGENDSDGAMPLYEKSLELLDGKEKNYLYAPALIYRILCIKGHSLDATKREDREEMLKVADRGLACDKLHYGLLDYKAWLLSRGKQYDEALEIYEGLLKNPYHSPSIDAAVGNIYYQDLEKNADKSLKYYLQSLERGGRPSGHFYAGMCYLYMGKLDEAEQQFLQLQEKEPDSIDPPYRLSFVYAAQGKTMRAIEEIDEAIRMSETEEGNYISYYSRKAALLRRLKRFDEAVDVIKAAMKRYDYPYGNRLIFQIYAQSAQLDKAEEHLRQWEKTDNKNSELNDCKILLELYRGDFAKAQKVKDKVIKYLSEDRALEVEQIISEALGDFRKQLGQIHKWLEYRQSHDSFDLSRIMGTLSQCYFRLGDMENARRYAAEALKEIDEHLNMFEPGKLLFMARKIRILAILGQKEEAEKLVEECREMPFCDSCPEHHCKDVDIFRMEMEEINGNYEEAYRIACECAPLYPDEEDFIMAKVNLEKKVR